MPVRTARSAFGGRPHSRRDELLERGPQGIEGVDHVAAVGREGAEVLLLDDPSGQGEVLGPEALASLMAAPTPADPAAQERQASASATCHASSSAS